MFKNPKIDGEMCTANGFFIYFMTYTSTLIGLINFPSTRCRLGYHGVWIIAPHFLPWVKELLLLYYVKLHRIYVYSSVSFTTSYSHHITIHIVPASPPPRRRVHRWGRRPPFPLWLLAVSYYPCVQCCLEPVICVPCTWFYFDHIF